MDSNDINLTEESRMDDIVGKASEEKQSLSQRRRGTKKIKRLKLNKRGRILLIGLSAALALVIILALTGVFGSAEAKIVNSYINSLYNPELNNIEKLYPEEFWSSTLEAFEDSVVDIESIQELQQFFTEDFKLEKGRLEALFGKDFRITFNIVDATEVGTDEKVRLTDFMEELYGIAIEDVEQIKRLDLDLSAKGSANQKLYNITVRAAKIRNEWYLINDNGAFYGFSKNIK